MIARVLTAGAGSLAHFRARQNITDLSCDTCKHGDGDEDRTTACRRAPPATATRSAWPRNARHRRTHHGSLQSNTAVVYISVDTEEGAQFYEGFGGLAALLRYLMM